MLNRGALSRHAGNMTQRVVAESTVSLSTANCADILFPHELGAPLKLRLHALPDLQAMFAATLLVAALDSRSSGWLKPVVLANSSGVGVSRRVS
jgi:hypothetical protein